MTDALSGELGKLAVRCVSFCLFFFATCLAAASLGVDAQSKIAVISLAVGGVVFATWLSAVIETDLYDPRWGGVALESWPGRGHEAGAPWFREMDYLASAVMHDARGTLAMLTLELDLLGGDIQDERVVQRVARLKERVRALSGRVAMLGRVPFSAFREVEDFDLNSAVERALALRMPDFNLAGISLEKDLSAQDALVRGNRVLLVEALLTVIENSIDALKGWSGPRRVIVRTGLSGDRVFVEVADSGPGIPPDIRTQIFEPGVTTKGGLGVGLAVAKGIIRTYGGSISAPFTGSGGAKVRVQLPHVRGARGRHAKRPASFLTRGSSPRVLIVDDEENLSKFLGQELEERGYVVDVAMDIGEARTKIREKSYDVILLDLVMPSGSGLDLLQELRTHAPEEAARVVFMTAFSEELSELNFGGEALKVVNKPFTVEEIEESLESVLQR